MRLRSLFLASLATTTLLVGPCDAGHAAFLAEWLYFKPSACNLGFVIHDERPLEQVSDPFRLPSGRAIAATPSYRSGFRVGASYLFDCSCLDVAVLYTYYHVHGRRSRLFIPINNSSAWVTFGSPKYNESALTGVGVADLTLNPGQLPGLFIARPRFQYDALEVQVGHARCTKSALSLRSSLALSYVRLNERLEAVYSGTGFESAILLSNQIEAVAANQRAFAIGPKFGIEGHYDLYCGFGLKARLGAGLFAGRTRATFDEIVTFTNPLFSTSQTVAFFPQAASLNFKSHHHLIPELDARLGVEYATCCCGTRFSLEIGYEWIAYINALCNPTLNGQGATLNWSATDFSLDGLYLMATLTF